MKSNLIYAINIFFLMLVMHNNFAMNIPSAQEEQPLVLKKPNDDYSLEFHTIKKIVETPDLYTSTINNQILSPDFITTIETVKNIINMKFSTSKEFSNQLRNILQSDFSNSLKTDLFKYLIRSIFNTLLLQVQLPHIMRDKVHPGLDNLLVIAARQGNLDIVQLIITYGKDPYHQEVAHHFNKTNNLLYDELRTALGIAYAKYAMSKKMYKIDNEKKYKKIVDYLISTFNLDKDDSGRYNQEIYNLNIQKALKSAWLDAVSESDLDIINHLLNSGFNINFQEEDGDTALHIALLQRNNNLVKYLLIQGADPNIQNNDKDTALHTFIYSYTKKFDNNAADILDDLLKYGADIDSIKDEDDDSALDLAKIYAKSYFNGQKVVNILEETLSKRKSEALNKEKL